MERAINIKQVRKDHHQVATADIANQPIQSYSGIAKALVVMDATHLKK